MGDGADLLDTDSLEPLEEELYSTNLINEATKCASVQVATSAESAVTSAESAATSAESAATSAESAATSAESAATEWAQRAIRRFELWMVAAAVRCRAKLGELVFALGLLPMVATSTLFLVCLYSMYQDRRH
jgi:hypothetical protein